MPESGGTASADGTALHRLLDPLLGDPLTFAVFVVLVLVIVTSWIAGQRARRQELLQMRIGGARTSAAKANRWLDYNKREAEPDATDARRGFLGSILARITPAVAGLPIFGDKDRAKVQHLLVIAGFRTPDAINIMFASKVFCGLMAGIVAYGYCVTADPPPVEGAATLVVFVLGLVAGSMVPELYVKHRARAMRRRIGNAVPDAMDLLVICAEAGLTLDSALSRVARELSLSAPEIAKELTITEAELRVLPDRRQALENLVYRTDVGELSSLVVTLSQAEKYGTSLSQALRTIASEGRRTRMLRVEEKAARLPAIMSVPLMLLILPPVVVVVAGPALLRLFDALG